MKKKALYLDIIREIKKSFGRFFSIFMIVAIGVAFFAGVRSSDVVMKNSADAYFDEYHLMDVTIMTTLGIDENEVEALKQIEEIEGIYPAYNQDVVVYNKMSQEVYELRSIPKNYKEDNVNYMNRMVLLEGRFPQQANECVIEGDKLFPSGYAIGDTIHFESGSDEALSDTLKIDEYVIVGKVATPYYLSQEKGSSQVGHGSVDHYAFIFEENFISEYYHELYVTLKNVRSINSYDDAYFDLVEPVVEEIETIIDEEVHLRYQNLYDEANQKLIDAQKEYDDGVVTFNQEIKDAQKEIDDGLKQLRDGEVELNNKESETYATIEQNYNDLVSKQSELDQGYQDYEKGVAQFESEKKNALEQKEQLLDQKKVLEDSLPQLQASKTQLEAAMQVAPQEQLAILQAQYQEVMTSLMTIEETLKQINSGIEQIDQGLVEAQAKLDESKKQLDDAQKQINDGFAQIKQAKIDAANEFQKARNEIASNKLKLQDAQAELDQAKIDGQKELDDALIKIEDGKNELAKLEEPQSYVLDRHSHYAYMDYGSAADRMGAIAKVFPLFFFLVAALVCLTTMTRMVDEKRLEIGTLKALGYGSIDIAKKFVIYAAIASVFGGIFGCVIGMYIFPKVIYEVWRLMYEMGNIHFVFSLDIALLAIILASAVTIIATILAVYSELSEVASQLMRPKPPKDGKKILLERIPCLWKRFKFSHKVSARNIFRYKKRFFMTVIGISGCSALLLSGFGIQDSIGDIAIRQYEELHHFDALITLEEDVNVNEVERLCKEMSQEGDVKGVSSFGLLHGYYMEEEEEKTIDIYVANQEELKEYINIRTRSNKPLTLDNQGIIISEKLAMNLNLKVGDTIDIDNGNEQIKPLKISGICENYVGHLLFINDAYYEQMYQEKIEDNAIVLEFKEVNDQVEQNFGIKYMSEESIVGINFYAGVAEGFVDMISSISIIVVVLVISAGLLAFVVLYNLTNVNISERIREIATIKVLGFYDKEVAAYVYRENIVLSFIGSICGLGIGIFLHDMIMDLAELENVMFGRVIEPISFIYAIAITMIFTFIVNLVMYKKLQNVKMVESLKSIE